MSPLFFPCTENYVYKMHHLTLINLKLNISFAVLFPARPHSFSVDHCPDGNGRIAPQLSKDEKRNGFLYTTFYKSSVYASTSDLYAEQNK